MGLMSFVEELAARSGAVKQEAASEAGHTFLNPECAEHVAGFTAKYEGAKEVAKRFGFFRS